MTQPETLRIGLVGAGRFAWQHLTCWQQIAGVQVAAVADVDAGRATALAATVPGCQAFADYREMLDRVPLDLLVVITPESQHQAPVLAGLEQGLHVFVEKPLASNPADARAMLAAARRSGRMLLVGHVLRFDPRYAAVAASLTRGDLGRVVHIYARRHNQRKYFELYRRTSPVLILGIHDIDVLHWLTGRRVSEVYALTTHAQGLDMADFCSALLRFEGGGGALLECGWLIPDGAPSFEDVRLEVVGTLGTAEVEAPGTDVRVWTDRGSEHPGPYSPVHGRSCSALLAELQHVVHCIRTGHPSDVLRPEDALEAVRVAAAIIESAQTGLPVRLGDETCS